MNLDRTLLQTWKQRGLLSCLLLPLSWLFLFLTAARRLAYRRGWLRQHRLPVPVVVIGNIIVGGSGKTPLTLWLCEQLRAAGWHPGIISRGYAARDTRNSKPPPCEVHENSPAALVGDEPLLLKQRSGVPVFIGRDRAAAGRALLAAYPECRLILSDDGLQHYPLARDIEIALMDERGVMNGWLLPAGPLREPPSRLSRVTAIVLNGKQAHAPAPAAHLPTFRMQLSGNLLERLGNPGIRQGTEALAGLRLAAICGIAVPERFFLHLESLGLTFSRHVFPDHHCYTTEDLAAIDADALLMTEKDAVKCRALGRLPHPVWVLPVTAQIEPLSAGSGLPALIEQHLMENPHGSPTA